MKDAPLNKKFQDAVKRIEQGYAETHVGFLLATLRDAVQELQQGGMRISLETHPRSDRGNSGFHTHVVGATTVAEGQKIDWLIGGSEWRAGVSSLDGVKPRAAQLKTPGGQP